MARVWYRCGLCRRLWPDEERALPVPVDDDIAPPPS
jgi:hypothetical protein